MTSGGSITVETIKSVILTADTRIVGLSSPYDQDKIFDAVYLRRAYGETGNTSERAELLTNMIELKQEEYLSLGTVELKFEVDS